jgi:hypothetical protein
MTTWTEGYRPTKEELKGLFQYKFETAGGLVIDCHLEFEASEPQTYNDPGCAGSIELIWALVGGIDISEVLGDAKDTIEEEALAEMEKAAKESAEDAAESRWESRRDDDLCMGVGA